MTRSLRYGAALLLAAAPVPAITQTSPGPSWGSVYESRNPYTVELWNSTRTYPDDVSTWEEANRLCAQKIDGVTGWRLPNRAEAAKLGGSSAGNWVNEPGVVINTSGEQTFYRSGGRVMCLHEPYSNANAAAKAEKAAKLAVAAGTAPATPVAPAGKPSSPAKMPVLTLRPEPKAPVAPPQPVAKVEPPRTYTASVSAVYGRSTFGFPSEAEARAWAGRDMAMGGDPGLCGCVSQQVVVAEPVICTVVRHSLEADHKPFYSCETKVTYARVKNGTAPPPSAPPSGKGGPASTR